VRFRSHVVVRVFASTLVLGAFATPSAFAEDTIGLTTPAIVIDTAPNTTDATLVDTTVTTTLTSQPLVTTDATLATTTDATLLTPIDGAALTTTDTAPSMLAIVPPKTVVAERQYGMNLFIWNHSETTARDLGIVNQAGFGWQKTLFQWREIEGKCKGCFDWSEADRVVKATSDAGVKLLVRIDFQPDWARADGAHNGRPDNLQDFADFARAVAERYKPGSAYGHVDAIEVWNEPNLQREWGEPVSQQSAANYVAMLKLAYKAVKLASPQTLIVTAGLSPTGWSDDTARPDDVYLGWLYDAGMSGNYDVLGLHGNSQVSDPTAPIGSVPGLADGSFYFRRVEQLRRIQETRGDGDKPVWLLEFGWTADSIHPAYAWFAVTEEQKAKNLLSAFQYARTNWAWLGTMFVWTMPDPSWNKEREEYWWAIAEPDGTPRPALRDILAAAKDKLIPS
jgi:polysaccharide biosynthesis protein PslG